MDDVEFKIMETILEIALDIFARGNHSFDFMEIRRASPMFSLPVLTEAVRQGYNIGVFERDSVYTHIISLSKSMQEKLWHYNQHVLDPVAPDLFRDVFGIVRHTEKRKAR